MRAKACAEISYVCPRHSDTVEVVFGCDQVPFTPAEQRWDHVAPPQPRQTSAKAKQQRDSPRSDSAWHTPGLTRAALNRSTPSVCEFLWHHNGARHCLCGIFGRCRSVSHDMRNRRSQVRVLTGLRPRAACAVHGPMRFLPVPRAATRSTVNTSCGPEIPAGPADSPLRTAANMPASSGVLAGPGQGLGNSPWLARASRDT